MFSLFCFLLYKLFKYRSIEYSLSGLILTQSWANFNPSWANFNPKLG